MTKKILCLVMVVLMLTGTSALACEKCMTFCLLDLWMKWSVQSELSQEQIENGIVSREVIGNTVVLQTAQGSTLTAPVTDRWIEQNARLEYLMGIYNQNFNN